MHTGPTIFVSQLVARIIAEQGSSNSGAGTKNDGRPGELSLSTRFSENQPQMPRESRQRGCSA